MRVLHFVECWLPQTETWLFNHIDFLPSNVEASVVCQWSKNLDQFPMENLFSLEKPPKVRSLMDKVLYRLGLQDDGKRHLPLLEEVIRRFKPHVLHSHFGHCGAINSALSKKYRLPHVVNFYGLDVNYLPTVEPRWITRYQKMGTLVDLVLCEGPHMANCISELGVPPEKIKVFRLGIDLSKIPFVPRTPPVGGTIRFLLAGTFREKKGIPFALEALGLFSKAHPDIQVTIVGDAGNAAREQCEKQEILDRIRRFGLGERVRFLGYQPHKVLIQEYYKHDVFLSPSVTARDGDTEGGAPVTVIEAAASGMPVVSTTHCDIPFVLSEQNAPYLVAERDSLALSQALDHLVHSSDWSKIVSANRQLVQRELDVRKQAQRLERAYAEVARLAPRPKQVDTNPVSEFQHL